MVVKVKVGTYTSADRLRDVVERVNRQPGWRFSLVFASAYETDEVVDAPPALLAVLQERTRNAEALLHADQKEAALLLPWSAVEGTLRRLGESADLPLASLPPSAI